MLFTIFITFWDFFFQFLDLLVFSSQPSGSRSRLNFVGFWGHHRVREANRFQNGNFSENGLFLPSHIVWENLQHFRKWPGVTDPPPSIKLKKSSFLERIGFPLVTFVNSVWKYFVCKNSPIRALSKIAFWSKDNCFKIFPKFCIRRDFRHAKISSFALLHFQQTSKLLPIFKYSYFRYYWSLTTDQADWLAVPFRLQIWTELSCEVEAQLDQGRCSCRGKKSLRFFLQLFGAFSWGPSSSSSSPSSFFCNFFFSGGFVWSEV